METWTEKIWKNPFRTLSHLLSLGSYRAVIQIDSYIQFKLCMSWIMMRHYQPVYY